MHPGKSCNNFIPSGSFFSLMVIVREEKSKLASSYLLSDWLSSLKKELQGYQCLKCNRREYLVVLALTRESSRSSSIFLFRLFIRPLTIHSKM